jgi:Ca2+-transporting ATPase
MVAAVSAGRKIFLDIQRAFLYLIGFHIPIILLALTPPIVGLPLLLMPVHLIWLELIVHPVSALLFQGDPPPNDLMQRPPRPPRAPMLPRAAVLRSALSGVLLSAAVFLAYWWRLGQGVEQARGFALATLIIGYQILVIVERGASAERASALLPLSLRFWIIWGAAAISLPILMYTPAAAALAGVSPLAPSDWLIAAVAAALAIGWRLILPARRARL